MILLARRKRFGEVSVWIAASSLFVAGISDLLILAYYGRHPQWIAAPVLADGVCLFAALYAGLLSTASLGWRRWTGLALALTALMVASLAAAAG